MATSAARDTKQEAGPVRAENLPVAASTTIWTGSLVADNNAGYAVPASASGVLIVAGVAQEDVDNSAGSAGDETVELLSGVVARFANSASADAIAITERYDICYAVDDETVAKTSGTGLRPIAGIVMDVDSTGVWVLVGPEAVRGRVIKVTKNITIADLTAAATNQEVPVTGTLPAGTMLLGPCQMLITTLVSGGAISNCNADVGYTGDANALAVDYLVFTGDPTGTLSPPALGVHWSGDVGGLAIICDIKATGANVTAATACDLTVTVLLVIP